MDESASKKVVLLCSGFGLGFYIPGILIAEKLKRLGVVTEVEVFESLLPENKIAMVEKSRQAYQASFRVALASQKIPADIRQSWDAGAVELLLARWSKEDCRHFICLSGHWVYVLDLYRQMRLDKEIHVDLLYLDADLSPSWKQLRKFKPDYAEPYQAVGLYDHARKEVRYSIDMNVEPPLPYSARSGRLVVHGGGWGIGTFNEYVPELERAGYGLDIVCYARPDSVAGPSGRRYYLDDPTWRTWHRNEGGRHTFPPFAELASDSGAILFKPQFKCHGLHRVIRKAMAIVSKPGAGSLIDSFGSATPLIMLEPFGPHEEANAEIWAASGFGIQHHQWAAAGYPISTLEKLHANLTEQRAKVEDYSQAYFKTLIKNHGLE